MHILYMHLSYTLYHTWSCNVVAYNRPMNDSAENTRDISQNPISWVLMYNYAI